MAKSKVKTDKKVRDVCKFNFSKIERVYAHLGMVHVEGKDGSVDTMSPKEAAIRAMAINEGLPTEPSSRVVAQKLIDTVIAVCREAMHQKECPNNSTTAAVTSAINGMKSYKAIDLDPAQRLLYDKWKLQFPMLDEYEIIVVIKRPEWTDSYKEGLLNAYHSDRMAVWTKDKKLTAPLTA